MPSIISTTSSRQHKPREETYTYTSPSTSPSSSRSRTSSSGSDSRFSSYTPTTLSSYHRRTHVDGLPDRTYFSSGQSKLDRKREYIQPPAAPRSPQALPSITNSRRGDVEKIGKEIVKYRPTVSAASRTRRDYRQDAAYDGDDEPGYDSDDERTIRPCDSISQVSYPSSYASSRGRKDSVVGGGSGSKAGSTFSSLSTFQSDRVFDGTRQCYLVERRPRASALVW